eukprot:g8084.t1
MVGLCRCGLRAAILSGLTVASLKESDFGSGRQIIPEIPPNKNSTATVEGSLEMLSDGSFLSSSVEDLPNPDDDASSFTDEAAEAGEAEEFKIPQKMKIKMQQSFTQRRLALGPGSEKPLKITVENHGVTDGLGGHEHHTLITDRTTRAFAA